MATALHPSAAIGLFRPRPRREDWPAGRLPAAAEPRAVAAGYDADADRIRIELANGAVFAFPPRLADALAGAGPKALASIEIVGRGHRLRWPALAADYSVGGLVAGIFGTPW